MSAQADVRRTSFGDRYWLHERIAVGGMAEIYRATQDSLSGFEKELVIKRLKPHLAADPRMVEMFLDEARIGAILNHPNIVHVYDVGEFESVPYIAMELIAGEELNILCRRGLGLGRFLPLQHAVELMRQAAIGLGFFHARRSTTSNRSLEIVHCDISPTNLLVTENGGLKIIDFGIARARHQRFREHGALPGKVSYMSPEQASRKHIDHRSDIFSLGVVLYEITVGRRLFKGRADEVVPRLIECELQPPTFIHHGFPGQLESIIMRALERHPDDRYQNAYDLADDLREFLRDANMRSGAMRIARYLDELAVAAGESAREELVSEHERRASEADDDELDFDRGMFDGFETVATADTRAVDWDEYDEDTASVAAALGVPESQLDRIGSKALIPDSSLPADALPLRAPRETTDDDVMPAAGPGGDGGGGEVAASDDPGSEEATAEAQTAPAQTAPAGTSAGTPAPAAFGTLHVVLLVWAVAATALAIVALLR